MAKVAKDIDFYPLLRVITDDTLDNNDAFDDVFYKALDKVRSWTKEEIIDWLFENIDSVHDSIEPYDPEYDED